MCLFCFVCLSREEILTKLNAFHCTNQHSLFHCIFVHINFGQINAFKNMQFIHLKLIEFNLYKFSFYFCLFWRGWKFIYLFYLSNRDFSMNTHTNAHEQKKIIIQFKKKTL